MGEIIEKNSAGSRGWLEAKPVIRRGDQCTQEWPRRLQRRSGSVRSFVNGCAPAVIPAVLGRAAGFALLINLAPVAFGRSPAVQSGNGVGGLGRKAPLLGLAGALGLAVGGFFV